MSVWFLFKHRQHHHKLATQQTLLQLSVSSLSVLSTTRVGRLLYGNIFVYFRQFGDSINRFHSASDRCNESISNKLVTSPKASFLSQLHNKKTTISKNQPISLQLAQCTRSFFTKLFGGKSPVKMVNVPKIKLSNGQEMPVLGLGTYQSKENEGEKAVKHAIDCGYRHIDTAYFYENEAEVGKAIKDKIAEGVIKREDVFIVTKLWNIHHEPDKVEYACRKSLAAFGLDYIDLYLIHVPVGYKYVDDKTLLPKDDSGKLMLSDVDYLDTWKEMEKLVELGLVKSIGISNFNSEQTERILKNCKIKPVTNQVECHPALNQKKLIEWSKKHDIVITAYCPLGRPKPAEKKPDFLFDDKIIAIADKYKKTPAQVTLRYLIQIGAIPIPKSVTKERIEQNIDVFDFKLTEDEMKIIDTYNKNERLVPFALIKEQNHKYFPFNIEF